MRRTATLPQQTPPLEPAGEESNTEGEEDFNKPTELSGQYVVSGNYTWFIPYKAQDNTELGGENTHTGQKDGEYNPMRTGPE